MIKILFGLVVQVGVFVLASGNLHCAPARECIGVNFAEIEPKIVGNPTEVSPGEYEGVVFLQFTNYTDDGRSKFCTGTLISPRTVMTAGHCLWNLSSAYSKKDYTKHPEEIVTWAGVVIASNLDPDDPRSGRIISHGAVAAKWHPRWQGGEPSDAVDMGLILLAPEEADGIKPYGLNRMPPEVGGKGIIAGYGKTNNGKKGIVKNMGITGIRNLTERTVGIGGESSICTGDSGGPLFWEVDGDLKVAGVASRTTWDCNPKSGSAARVDTRLSWIDSVMGQWQGAFPDPAIARTRVRELEGLDLLLKQLESITDFTAPVVDCKWRQ